MDTAHNSVYKRPLPPSFKGMLNIELSSESFYLLSSPWPDLHAGVVLSGLAPAVYLCSSVQVALQVSEYGDGGCNGKMVMEVEHGLNGKMVVEVECGGGGGGGMVVLIVVGVVVSTGNDRMVVEVWLRVGG
ncbi:hypothetical protein Acr_19g0003890 [Actinidia rufa]|uniref:Uncharacterized protein n=1 Tax=Actinidia rufa TaxID=165716 RepID=A0A7J0G9N3_9ERIC|nr:hypothetical protein Acr_19g0003890 [Actinidia rufa]